MLHCKYGLGCISCNCPLLRIQTLATRYPKFSSAHVVAPRPLGSFLFKPICEEIQQIFPDPEQNQTDVPGRREYQSLVHYEHLANILSSDPQNTTIIKSAEDCASTSTAWFNTCVELFQAGLSIAFVSVLETLISAKIASKITKVKCNQRKEV